MSTLQFYRTIADDTVAARCLALIERHAPGLMRCGGGALAGDCVRKQKRTAFGPEMTPVSPKELARIIALFEAGHDLHAIARMTRRSYNCIVRKTRELRQRRDAQ